MRTDDNPAGIFAELMSNAFKFHTSEMYTSIPGVVVSVRSPKEQLIDVQPLVNIVYDGGTTGQRSVIYGVPYIFPATNNSALIIPVNVGDTVMLMFSMKAIENFKQGDGLPADPSNWARFDVKDAVAILGLFPQKKAVNDPTKHSNEHSMQDVVLVHNLGKSNEVEVRLRDSGGVVVNCNTLVVNATTSAHVTTPSLTVDANNTTWNGDMTFNGNINQNGTLTASGDVVGGGVSLVGHTHAFEAQSGSDVLETDPPT